MRIDLKQYEVLEKQYPGVIKLIRYEDFIRNFNETLHEIYNHFHEQPPQQVYQQLMDYMYSSKGDTGKYSQYRANASDHLESWRKLYSNETVAEMNQECLDVLQRLDYTV